MSDDLHWLRDAGLAYGCMNVCGSWKEPKDDPAAPILAAFEAGFRVFDHADIYAGGKGEAAFKTACDKEPNLRREAKVVTKFGHVFPKWDSGQPHHYDTTAGHLRESTEASLKRLGVERIDLMLIHRPDPLTDYAELGDAFDELRRSGRIAAFGVSNFTPLQCDAARAAGLPARANQVRMSCLDHAPITNGTLDDCLAHDVVPMAWAPHEKGKLGDAEVTEDIERVNAVRDALDATGLPRDVAALAWLRTHPAGVVPVIGTTSPARIRSAYAAADKTLERLDWYKIYLAAGGELP